MKGPATTMNTEGAQVKRISPITANQVCILIHIIIHATLLRVRKVGHCPEYIQITNTMRMHLLKELTISGQENALRLIPDFDFYKLQQIVRLTWEIRYDKKEKITADLVMTITYDTSSTDKAEVTLRFAGATRVKFPELLPFLFLSEVEIEDVSDTQLEGVRYTVKNYGSTELEISCKDIEIIDCEIKGKARGLNN